MIRKKKLFVRPRKLYVKARISEENKLASKYGLKSKVEIWKTQAKINYFRHRAMDLAAASSEEQQVLFDKLQKIGLNTKTISDVLALDVEKLLERRLPSILVKKKLAITPQEARQMVAHKRVMVDNKTVDVPSYIVSIEEESKVTVRARKVKTPKAVPVAEVKPVAAEVPATESKEGESQ